MPGARKGMRADEQEEEITISKLDLGSAEIITTVVKSEDIYDHAVAFKFLFDDVSLVGMNSTIEFYLESSNGLRS
jgi:hypothetical protein